MSNLHKQCRGRRDGGCTGVSNPICTQCKQAKVATGEKMSHERMLAGDKQPRLSPTVVLVYHNIGLFTQGTHTPNGFKASFSWRSDIIWSGLQWSCSARPLRNPHPHAFQPVIEWSTRCASRWPETDPPGRPGQLEWELFGLAPRFQSASLYNSSVGTKTKCFFGSKQIHVYINNCVIVWPTELSTNIV